MKRSILKFAFAILMISGASGLMAQTNRNQNEPSQTHTPGTPGGNPPGTSAGSSTHNDSVGYRSHHASDTTSRRKMTNTKTNSSGGKNPRGQGENRKNSGTDKLGTGK